MINENKVLPDLSEFHFTTYYFLLSLDYPFHLISPVLRKAFRVKDTQLSLTELSTVLGVNIEDESVRSSLERQQKRFNVYNRLYKALALIGYFLIAILTVFSFALGMVVLPLNIDLESGLVGGLVYVIIGLIFYMAFKLSSRIVSVLLDRYYLDTLSFATCLFLLANLTKKDSLAHPRDRKHLLDRIDALKKYLMLLPLQYATTSLPPTSPAFTQFKSMAEFIEEKENEIIAPRASSQVDLFFHLQAFLPILLTGTYGDFKHLSSTKANAMPPSSNPTGILSGILKFLGSIFPLILLLLMYFFPAQFSALGLENRVITLISLAWLLLAIDANLKLGIVERVSGLAKAFKELS